MNTSFKHIQLARLLENTNPCGEVMIEQAQVLEHTRPLSPERYNKFLRKSMLPKWYKTFQTVGEMGLFTDEQWNQVMRYHKTLLMGIIAPKSEQAKW